MGGPSSFWAPCATLAGRFLGWLSSPTRPRCRTAGDWRADERVLVALGLPLAAVRDEPSRSLGGAQRHVTALALAELIGPPCRDGADRTPTAGRVDNRHSAYYGPP